MLNVLNRFSIRHRLFLIVAVAAIVLLGFSSPRLLWSYYQRSSAIETLASVELAKTASALVHQLQRERGNSSGLISSNGGSAFRQQLAEQRALSDDALKGFEAKLAEKVDIAKVDRAKLSDSDATAVSVIEKIAELDDIRAQVDDLALTNTSMSSFYTGLVTELLSLFSDTLLTSKNPEVVSQGAALIALLEAKERSGRERSAGVNGFNAEVFPLDMMVKQQRLIAQQEAFFHSFRGSAPNAFFDRLQSMLKGPEEAAIVELRSIAFQSAQNQSASGIVATDWFAAATQRIDALFAIENDLAEHLLTFADEAKSQATASIIALSVAVLGCVGVLGVLSTMLSESIRRPVSNLMTATKAMRDGAFDEAIGYQNSGSEIGEFARNLHALQDSLKEAEHLRREQEAERERRAQEESERLERQKKRELDERIRAERAAAAQQNAISESLQELSDVVRQELTQMIDQLFDLAKQARGSSANLITCSDRVTNDVNSATQASEAAAQSSQSIAAAAEEMNVSLTDVTTQVGATRELIRTTASDATTVSDSLSGLTTAANKIADMVTIISDIAEQTNLLALNATIEAARAGEAGKGFAVVASEVKSLANQTSRSLDEIQSGVDVMQDEVKGAVSRVQSIATQISELTERSDSVSDAVTEQSNVTNEIAQAIQSAFENVNAAASQIGSVAKENSAMVESSGDISSLTTKIEQGVTELQSRLIAVIAETNEKSERRRAERLDVHNTSTVTFVTEGDKTFHAPVKDVSDTGLNIDLSNVSTHFKVGDVLKARWDNELLDCLVIWNENGACGLSFLDKTAATPMVRTLQSTAQSADALAKAS